MKKGKIEIIGYSMLITLEEINDDGEVERVEMECAIDNEESTGNVQLIEFTHDN